MYGGMKEMDENEGWISLESIVRDENNRVWGKELVWKDAYMKRCRFLGVGRVYVWCKKRGKAQK